jgi:hypothetical protein
MAQNPVDLANIFGMVTQALAENQSTINQADPYNQNHGSNMVQTFETITQALEQKRGSSNSSALKYAAKQVARNTSSGSGQLYAQHLAQAADQFKGKQVDQRGALDLLQTLIGSSQPGGQAGGGDPLSTLLGSLNSSAGSYEQQTPQGGGDLLGSLMGSLAGGEASAQPSAQQGGDLFGTLLGGLGGGQASSQSGQAGFGLDDLMNAGMAYFQAKQQGGSNLQAIAQAFMAGSGMGADPHRQESTAVVVNTFLQALGGMAGKGS